MPCDNINTGGFVHPHMHGRGPCKHMVSAPGKQLVLFTQESPPDNVYSPTFTVVPGQSVLLEAYNLPEDGFIKVNRVVISTTCPTVGSPCDPNDMKYAYGTPGVIMFRAPMMLGGRVWGLRAYQSGSLDNNGVTATCDVMFPQLLINIPGTYELELSDTSLLGDLEVEGLVWDNALTPEVPQTYYAGVSSMRIVECGEGGN